MSIEVRQNLAPRNHVRASWQILHQADEWRLHLQHDTSSTLRDQRDVAHELKRIAKTLLRVQQDGPTCKIVHL